MPDLPGILVVLSGPSGVGKTTVAERLIHKGYVRSVSVTTRQIREGEIEGQDYHFVSVEQFMYLRDNDKLIEHAEVHGNFYGTPKSPVYTALESNKAYLLVIDVQGGNQVKLKNPNSVLIFLTLKPEELAKRLAARGTEDADQQAIRLERATLEIQHSNNYDHVVVNEELNQCVETVHQLVLAARQNLEKSCRSKA